MNLRKYLCVTSLFVVTALTTASAQNSTDAYVLDGKGLSESQLVQLEKKAPKDGWVVFKYYGQNFVFNYSNKDYKLRFSANCFDTKKQPSFLIEYSDSYIDFISSANDDDFTKITFLVDGKNFNNPFRTYNKAQFDTFIKALKSSKKLTVAVSNSEFNPETGKDEWTPNRSIDFLTGNSKALDTAVECN